jgi:hypothetical protein
MQQTGMSETAKGKRRADQADKVTVNPNVQFQRTDRSTCGIQEQAILDRKTKRDEQRKERWEKKEEKKKEKEEKMAMKVSARAVVMPP